MLIRVIENFPFRAVNKPSCKIVGCKAFSKAAAAATMKTVGDGDAAGTETAAPLKFVFHPSNRPGVL